MKRSEMIKQMAESWLGLFPRGLVEEAYYKEEMIEEVEGRMGKLLAFMEHKGMKPPVEEVDPVIYTTKYVWEPENK